jgi:hypothetical protein
VVLVLVGLTLVRFLLLLLLLLLVINLLLQQLNISTSRSNNKNFLHVVALEEVRMLSRGIVAAGNRI